MSLLRTKNHTLLTANSTGRIRACVLARNELNIFLLSNFSNEDFVTTRREGDAGEPWIASGYMPDDDEVEPPPTLLKRALSETWQRKANVIIGSDAN